MHTRETIVQAADTLFYERGFEHTSFADIAQAVQISRGNFYYHFRTKDDILQAVITARMERTRAMLAQWEEELEQPAKRIAKFVEILIRNQSKIMRFGCPVGSLCMELTRLEHLAKPGADGILALFRGWLVEQFSLLGRRRDADELALRLLAQTQGVALLAQTLNDAGLIRREVNQMIRWLESLMPDESRRT